MRSLRVLVASSATATQRLGVRLMAALLHRLLLNGEYEWGQQEVTEHIGVYGLVRVHEPRDRAVLCPINRVTSGQGCALCKLCSQSNLVVELRHWGGRKQRSCNFELWQTVVEIHCLMFSTQIRAILSMCATLLSAYFWSRTRLSPCSTEVYM